MRVLIDGVAIVGVEFEVKDDGAGGVLAQVPHGAPAEEHHVTRLVLYFHAARGFQPWFGSRIRIEARAQLRRGVERIGADIVLRVQDQGGASRHLNREPDCDFRSKAVLVSQWVGIRSVLVSLDVAFREHQARGINPA